MLKAKPFEPIRVGLSDGRSVLIRHPDQAVVTERNLIVGLATIERSGPMATPRTGDAIARDWILINLLQITGVEPADGTARRPRRKPRK
ncbi:MAG: hypothetical protein IH988_04470 [Planctomycetes bacterium]|nr:hypothetical protein [Planctomycetota bacterium]